MRDLLSRTGRWALVAGAALLAASCGGGDEAANTVDANAIDANVMFEETGNDQSAMESVANTPEPVTETGNQATDSSDVLGNTSGGDTGGNVVDSNVSGM